MAPDDLPDQLVSDQLIYHGSRTDYVIRTIRTPSGKTLTREVVVHPGAVIILPVLDDGRLVMIRNHRHTVLETLWELPAGTLEKGEDPAACAGRELIEETGYTAKKIESLGWFYTSPGILSEKMYAFVATGLSAGSQHLEESEDIIVEPRTAAQVKAMIQDNQIVDAKTIATVLKYLTRTD